MQAMVPNPLHAVNRNDLLPQENNPLQHNPECVELRSMDTTNSTQLTSNVFDTALIFEGGGMRASYTCAVVVAMLENGIYFDNVYGLSAGSSNAGNYVSRDADRAKRSFIDLVLDPLFGGTKTFLQHKGFFSAEHIYQDAGKPGGFLPFDLQTFLANPAKITIEAFERETGKSVYWTKDDMQTLEDLMVRVRASSTLPFFMPPPKIGESYYYDGGLGEGAGFTLPKAQRDGFDRFVIIRTRPKGYRKKPQSAYERRLMRGLFWKRPEVYKALESRWIRYNALCEEIERLEAEGKAFVFYAEKQAVDSGETDYSKLAANYETGYAQAMRDLPALKEFVGL